MFGSTIFLLSAAPVADVLIREAAARGVQLDAIPFIRPMMLPLSELPQGLRTVVFTSQHAVEAIAGAQRPGWSVFCIEGATQRKAAQRFGEAAIMGVAASAAALAEVIIDRLPAQAITFFCGDQRREELPVRLREKGFSVEERVVYRTVATPRRLEQHYDGIAFFSPSAVESFFSLNGVGPRTTPFAIGETTAAAIRAHCSNTVIVASRPDKNNLIQQMITHYTT